MFSFKPPRKLVQDSRSILPASSSSTMTDDADVYHPDDHRFSHSTPPYNSPFDSSSVPAGTWSASTLVDGHSLAGRHSRAASVPATRMSHRHSGPFFHDFSLELPENPLRAALGLESVLEEPISESRLESGDSGCMVAHSLLDFSRRQVGSIKPHKSALSTVVTSLQIPNPFAAEAQWEAIGSSSSLTIQVYFPHTENPTGQLLALSLPANSTVEDAIALALWTYWERRWLPALDASKARDTNIASWIMLVPGKNGAVNKRIAQSKMGHFNFDKYAIVRSPRNLHEKQKVQMQISSFERVPPPPVTVPEKSKRHIRHHSLPILKLGSGRLDAPVSFSRLP